MVPKCFMKRKIFYQIYFLIEILSQKISHVSGDWQRRDKVTLLSVINGYFWSEANLFYLDCRMLLPWKALVSFHSISIETEGWVSRMTGISVSFCLALWWPDFGHWRDLSTGFLSLADLNFGDLQDDSLSQSREAWDDLPVLGEESEEVWLTEAVVGVVEVAGPLVVQGRRELLAVSLAGAEAVVLADHLEVVSLVLAAHQIVLHLVAAGDVAQVLDLELLQQVLLGDACQQLWLASEVITVLVIIVWNGHINLSCYKLVISHPHLGHPRLLAPPWWRWPCCCWGSPPPWLSRVHWGPRSGRPPRHCCGRLTTSGWGFPARWWCCRCCGRGPRSICRAGGGDDSSRSPWRRAWQPRGWRRRRRRSSRPCSPSVSWGSPSRGHPPGWEGSERLGRNSNPGGNVWRGSWR